MEVLDDEDQTKEANDVREILLNPGKYGKKTASRPTGSLNSTRIPGANFHR